MISVLEIKSATLRTKLFHGFDQKQIGFLVVGIVRMSLIDYHRLIDVVHYV